MPAHCGCLITVHSEKKVDRLALSAVRLSTNAFLDEAHHGERVHYQNSGGACVQSRGVDTSGHITERRIVWLCREHSKCLLGKASKAHNQRNVAVFEPPTIRFHPINAAHPERALEPTPSSSPVKGVQGAKSGARFIYRNHESIFTILNSPYLNSLNSLSR
jgi:hypothetical protein